MSKQIRSKEALVQITENRQRLGTTMLKILDFKWNPEAEITKTRFLGDSRETPDLDVKGASFSFKTQKQDHVWFDLWNRIQQAEEQGNDLPDISLAISYSYRGTTATRTIVLHGELVMKLDDDDLPADGGYQVVSWSGSCQYADGT
jgi:hypothetical protein